MANNDEHHSDFLWKIPHDRLLLKYQELGDICEAHSIICDCEECLLFLAVGDEVHRRRRAMTINRSKRNH